MGANERELRERVALTIRDFSTDWEGNLRAADAVIALLAEQSVSLDSTELPDGSEPIELREIIAATMLLHDTGEQWSEAIEVGEEKGWLSAADAVIETLKNAQYPTDAAVEALSDAEIVTRCKAFVSHEQDGLHVLTFSVPLWGRILRLLDRTEQSFGEGELDDAEHWKQKYIALHEWACRMPDAGFNDQDPRWDWWHRRPR